MEKMFENGGHIQDIAPGQGQTTPWGQIFFINSIIQFLPYMGMAAILVM